MSGRLARALFLVVALVPFIAGGPAAAEPAPGATGASKALSARIGRDYPSVQAIAAVRGGCLVWDFVRPPAKVDALHPVFSVTKSVLSILVGIAIDRGYLRLTEKLGDVIPESRAAGVDPRVRDITVGDLLTMTSGFDPADIPGAGPARSWRWLLGRRMVENPGVSFAYDGVSADLLSVVLTKAIRQNPKIFATTTLFRPLGVRRYGWTTDSEGHLIAAGTLSLSVRDMAKIGLLTLRQGLWRGRRIVSETFLADSTRKHNAGGPPEQVGYGYLWWVEAGARRAFFAAGMGGQILYVAPERDLVVAVASTAVAPEGSRAFVETILAPALAGLPPPHSCAPLDAF